MAKLTKKFLILPSVVLLLVISVYVLYAVAVFKTVDAIKAYCSDTTSILQCMGKAARDGTKEFNSGLNKEDIK